MRPPPFVYERPASLEEALDRLADLGDEAKVLAGGQSLVPLLALRLARPAVVVDIGRLPGLDATVSTATSVTLDALVTHHRTETAEGIGAAVPLLADALPLIGHRSVRNRGTVCGSLAHGDPAAELPAVAAALDATVTLQSTRGRRVVDASAFFAGYLTTAVQPDELVVQVTFPVSTPGSGWRFEEMTRRHGDFAIVGVAAGVQLDEAGRVAAARLAVAGVESTPLRRREAEQLLLGVDPGDEVWREAAERAADDLFPPDDLHGSRAYRIHLVRVLVRRALAEAARRAVAGGPNPDGPGAAGTPPARAVPAPEAPLAAAGSGPPRGADGRLEIVVEVNGEVCRAVVEPRTTLASALRVQWQLTGTHLGCEHGVCGACTVLIDGASARSCITLAVQADGHRVQTIEGLGAPDSLHPLQQACLERHSFQCGFCTPGFLMTAAELLEESPSPSEAAVRERLAGNLCRCTGYQSIVDGVVRAGELVQQATEDGALAAPAGSGPGGDR